VEEVQRLLALKLTDMLSEPEVWIVDDTSFPKAGSHSIGVARQYCGALGKIANCQVAVTLHWSSWEASCPLGWRLYLPEEWVNDSARLAEVKVPAGITYKSRTALALELIDQMLEWKVPKLPVVADTWYGNDFGFREELRKRGLLYVMEVEPSTVAWTTDPNGPPSAAPRGRPRKNPVARGLPQPKKLRAIAEEIPSSAWRTVAWRQGSKGVLKSRFALTRVWAAHDWRRRSLERWAPEWLLIQWPENDKDPLKYWLADMGEQQPGMRRMARTAHSRWRIELDYRELKDELGLDHYEGRHWSGWYHHVTLVTLAYAFLRSEQARAKKNSWCDLADDAAQAPSAPD
jgi:SRSO17 transposase